MKMLLWIPCTTIILTICIVQAIPLTCTVTLCSIPNFCENGKECQQDPNTCQEECICTDNVTLCKTNEVKVSTKLAMTHSTITTVPLPQNNDCLSNYTKNTHCYGGLPCVYGNCVINHVALIWKCECYPGASGVFCDDSCCLDCGPHGVCAFDKAKNSQSCNCLPDYTGEVCAILKPIGDTTKQERQADKETWYLWLVGVCAVVLLLLLLLLIVLPYLMWKHRFILIMKIVHYFQPYEDQDDRVWDAFVSYRSDPFDEMFVLQKLIPSLEKEMNFKLNIHLRDFAVGETIANNIIQAVQNSRRTILVMSKNYVKSEFTRFEYQCAQQEMLQRKHRIIPVLLEDITEIKDTIDPTLKVILNSVTYIEWPGDNNAKEIQKFWKRLELSMPKIRNIKNEGITIKQDVTIWPESISIRTIDDKKCHNVLNSEGNESADEGKKMKATQNDYIDFLGRHT